MPRLGLRHDPSVFRQFHQVEIRIVREGTFPQMWRAAVIKALHIEKGRIESRTYCSISLIPHAGNVLLKMVATRLDNHCEAKGMLPEEPCGFRSRHSLLDMMFPVRKLKDSGWKARVSLCLTFLDRFLL